MSKNCWKLWLLNFFYVCFYHSHNNFDGTFPIEMIEYKSTYLDITYNKFTKFEFKQMAQYSNDYYSENYYYLNNNNLYIEDIGSILNFLFNNKSAAGINVLTLHSNENINGDISIWKPEQYKNDLNQDIYNHIQVLTLNNCNIYGKISNKLNLTNYNLRYISLFNNHISCPMNIEYKSWNATKYQSGEINYTGYFLLGNLMSESQDIKKFDPIFSNVNGLYLSDVSLFLSDVYVSTGLICLLLIILYLYYQQHYLTQRIKYLQSQNYSHNDINAKNVKNAKNAKNAKKYGRSRIRNEEEMKSILINTMDYFYQMLTNPIILLLTVSLSVIYYLNSNYMTCGRQTSHFGLSYFYNYDQTEIYIQWIMICIFIIFNIYIIFQLLKIYNRISIVKSDNTLITRLSHIVNQRDSRDRDHDIDGNSLLIEQSLHSQSQSDFESIIEQQQQQIQQQQKQQQVSMSPRAQRLQIIATPQTELVSIEERVDGHDKDFSILQTIFLVIFYFLNIFMTVIYMLLQNLPNDNVLHLNNEILRYCIDYSIIFILTLTNIYIIPLLSDSIIVLLAKINIARIRHGMKRDIDIDDNDDNYNSNHDSDPAQYRAIIVLTLRSFSTIIIPLISSLIFLSQCGNGWALFWNPCQDNITFSQFTLGYGDSEKIINVGNHKSICGLNNELFNSVHSINKCFRSFFDVWIPIVCAKLMLMIINPWIIIVYKQLKIDVYVKNRLLICWNSIDKKICTCCCFCKCNNKIAKRGKIIKVDSEYTMILTKLEIFILFCMISPFITFIISIAILSNMFAYKRMLYTFKYNLHNTKSAVAIPVLFISILFQQIFIIVFISNEFDTHVTGTLIGALCLVDLITIGLIIYKKCK